MEGIHFLSDHLNHIHSLCRVSWVNVFPSWHGNPSFEKFRNWQNSGKKIKSNKNELGKNTFTFPVCANLFTDNSVNNMVNSNAFAAFYWSNQSLLPYKKQVPNTQTFSLITQKSRMQIHIGSSFYCPTKRHSDRIKFVTVATKSNSTKHSHVCRFLSFAGLLYATVFH